MLNLKAWRAHQAEVRRRAEAGEPPLKTIEDFRVEIPDSLTHLMPDLPDGPEPGAADNNEGDVRSDARARTVQNTGVQSSETGVGGERPAKVPRVE